MGLTIQGRADKKNVVQDFNVVSIDPIWIACQFCHESAEFS